MTSPTVVTDLAVSSPTASPTVQAERERHFWPSIWALGVGSFAIGTGEFVIMGLLPEVARDLGVSIPEAGHVISTYALPPCKGEGAILPVFFVRGCNGLA